MARIVPGEPCLDQQGQAGTGWRDSGNGHDEGGTRLRRHFISLKPYAQS